MLKHEVSMRKNLLIVLIGLLLAILALFIFFTGSAQGSAPARTVTIAAGSYIVDVQFSQDPPYVDQPLMVTVIPHNHSLKLNGTIITSPGLGTDATALHYSLTATGNADGSLQGSIRMPVRGAWNIELHLQGSAGAGVATIPTTVGSPGAMPFWLAWLIGSLPLVFIIYWILHQHFYRRNALVKEHLLQESI
jgi:hypothetical protein